MLVNLMKYNGMRLRQGANSGSDVKEFDSYLPSGGAASLRRISCDSV